MEHKKTGGHLAALLTIMIWGTTFISTKILLADFQPVEILFFRFIMGFLILLRRMIFLFMMRLICLVRLGIWF